MTVLQLLQQRRKMMTPWSDLAPARAELFGVERLEQHVISLAADQPIATRTPLALSLQLRLTRNAAVLLQAYNATAAELNAGRDVMPAAE